MKKISSYVKDNWFIFLFAVGIMSALYIFVSYTYVDIIITSRNGINFWSAIKDSSIFKFYTYNSYLQGYAPQEAYDYINGAAYPLPIYLIFALWNLPLWIMEYYLNVDIVSSFWALLYQKCILIIFVLLSIVFLLKIAKQMKINIDNRYTAFLFLSSPLLFSCVFVLSQYDIIPIVFVMVGLYNLFNDKKGYFIFFFSLAISLKLFALLIFIPVLLLNEKKIIEIITDIIFAISPTAVCKLLFFNDYSRIVDSSFGNTMLYNLTGPLKEIGVYEIYIFIFLYACICLWAYFQNVSDVDSLIMLSCYSGFVVFGSFIFFSICYPYWVIYILPFTILLMIRNQKTNEIMVVDTIFESFLFFLQMIFRCAWSFDNHTVSNMFNSLFMKGGKDLGYDNYNYLANKLAVLFTVEKASEYMALLKYVMQSVTLACMVSLIIFLYPKRTINEKEDRIPYRPYLFVRLAICFVLSLFQIIKYY